MTDDRDEWKNLLSTEGLGNDNGNTYIFIMFV